MKLINKNESILLGFSSIEKGKKLDIGTVNKHGGTLRIKVADIPKRFDLNWRSIDSPKAVQSVLEEFPHNSQIRSALERGGYTNGAANVDSDSKGSSDGSPTNTATTLPELPEEKRSGDPVIDAFNRVSMSDFSPMEKFAMEYKWGERDPRNLASTSGLPYSEVIEHIEKLSQFETYTDKELQIIAERTKNLRLEMQMELADISTEARWNTYKNLLNDIVSDRRKSMLAYGTGGVGKTWNMHKAMENFVVYDGDDKAMKQTIISKDEFYKKFGPEAKFDSNDIEGERENEWRELRAYDSTLSMDKNDYEYVVFGGKVSASETHIAIYQHNGKIMVFDDMDSVLENKEGINTLKGALDNEEKEIQWLVKGKLEDMHGNSVPKSFIFNGRAIFISNLTEEKIFSPELQPITQSRAATVNLSMTKKETLELMRGLVDKNFDVKDAAGESINATKEEMTDVINLLEKYKDITDIGWYNARALGSLIKTRQSSDNWVTESLIQLGHAKDASTEKLNLI